MATQISSFMPINRCVSYYIQEHFPLQRYKFNGCLGWMHVKVGVPMNRGPYPINSRPSLSFAGRSVAMPLAKHPARHPSG